MAGWSRSLLNGVEIDGRLAEPSRRSNTGGRARRVVEAFERHRRRAGGRHRHRSRRGPDHRLGGIGLRRYRRGTASLPIYTASAFPASITAGGEHDVVLQFPTATLGGDVVLTYLAASSAQPAGLRVDVDELGTP